MLIACPVRRCPAKRRFARSRSGGREVALRLPRGRGLGDGLRHGLGHRLDGRSRSNTFSNSGMRTTKSSDSVGPLPAPLLLQADYRSCRCRRIFPPQPSQGQGRSPAPPAHAGIAPAAAPKLPWFRRVNRGTIRLQLYRSRLQTRGRRRVTSLQGSAASAPFRSRFRPPA